MKPIKNIFLLLIIIGLIFSFTLEVKAQETTTSTEPVLFDESATEEDIIDEVKQDENIVAEDFDIAEPWLLPTNPYYPIKNIWRGIRSIFTFNPIKKAELRLRFANERLIEAKKVAEKTNQPKVVIKALENYQKELSTVAAIILNAPEEVQKQAEKLAEKMIDYSFKQQRLIDNIERRLEPEHFEKLNQSREKGVKYFALSVAKIIPPEQMEEKFIEIINQQKGSDFKNFKNLEILKLVEEKIPEAAKEAIHRAQENTLKRFKNDIEIMTAERREIFKEYVNQVGGNEVRHLEIIQDFARQEIPEIIRQEIEKAKEKTIRRIDKKMKEFLSEDQKTEFLHHLEQGRIEDLRIIKELENNLAPETINKILEIKNKSLDNFRQDFEKASTPEEQEKYFKKMEKFYDVKQFEIFKEIEKIIPEEKKEFFAQIKERAIKEMEQEFARAKSEGRQKLMLQSIAGDALEHFEIIKEFGPTPELLNEILKEQTEKLRRRIENTKDAEKLYFLKKRITEEGEIRKELEKRAPELFRNIEEKSNLALNEIKKDEAIHQFEIAKNELTKTENYLRDLKNKPRFSEHLKGAPVESHLINARKHLAEAQGALSEEKYGHVFGAANATLHELRNVGRIIKDIELRDEIGQKRMDEMQEMMEVREEIMDEFEKIKEKIIKKGGELTEEILQAKIREEMELMREMIKEKENEFDLNERQEHEIMREREKMEMMKEIMEVRTNQERTEPREATSSFFINESQLSEQQIEKINLIRENLPLDIQYKLRNIPADMIPEILKRLEQIPIRTIEEALPLIQGRPMPPTIMPIPSSGGEQARPPILEPDHDDAVCPSWVPPIPGWCQDGKIVYQGEDVRGCKLPPRCIRSSEETLPSSPVPPVACAAWMFDAEGCKRKGGDVIKQGFDENNCELPPKCIFTTSSPVPPVACAAWMFDAEGCKRKGGNVIKQGFDENNCELPPKCIFTTSSDSISPVICIQVITPAKNPKTGECRRFPTPCDVPADWQKVERCENELLEFNKTEEEFRLREKLRLLEEETKLSY